MKRSNKEQFVRYAQFGCMTACMINGGEMVLSAIICLGGMEKMWKISIVIVSYYTMN